MERRGFTLIELIVIIATVLILAAILFPVFSRSNHRVSDPRARCQSNLKQIALGVFQYAQDYDERYPPANNSRHGLEHSTNWIGLLQPYLKSTQVFRCSWDKAAKGSQKSSYAYNAWLDKQNTKILEHPLSTILNFEVIADPNNWTQTGTGPQAVSAKIRHDGVANYSFTDGHVKWLKPEAVTAEKPNGKNYTFAIK